jgi:uncharacterized membrane protein (DUF106 family)
MTSEIVMALVGVLCTAISSIVTFFLTRKKYNTEVDSQQIDNMSKSFDTYKRMMEEALDAQKRTMESKINELQKENEFLRQQVDTLRNQMIQFLGAKLTTEKE